MAAAAAVTFTSKTNGTPERDFYLFMQNVVPKQEDVKVFADFLLHKIVSDATAGLDINGAPFAPYSPTSRKKGPVTLRSQGSGPHLLDSVEYRWDGPDSTSFELGIFDNYELATRAQTLNEGGIIRTAYGSKLGLKRPKKQFRKIGNKYKRTYFEIPARNWLGASPQTLQQGEEMIFKSINSRLSRIWGF